MGGTTTAPWSIPYPTGTDRVADGDNAIQAVADRVTLLLGQSLNGAPLPYTVVPALAAGWTGVVLYGMKAGWVSVYVGITRATWGVTEGICTIPAGYRPGLTQYSALMAANGAVPIMCSLAIDGGMRVQPASSTAGGLYGGFSYPLIASAVGDDAADNQLPTTEEGTQ